MVRMTAINGAITKFRTNSQGGAAVQVALLFGAIGLAVALLATPALDAISEQYAGSSYGVDNILTGTVAKEKRYIMRRSVLNPSEEKLCPTNGVC